MSYIPINPASFFNSPVFTGDPTAPTPTTGDNDTSLATTAFVAAALSAGGTFIDAPSDGSLYGRQNAGWTKGAPLASPALTGTPTAPTPTAGDNGASIATTAFVTAALVSGGGPPPATVPPLMDGAVAVGTATKYAREDHVHPSDTSRATVTYVDSQDALKAPLASPTFTGDPRAPTPSPGDNDTSIATTAFVAAAVSAGGTFIDAPSDGSLYGRLNAGWTKAAPLASPVLTGTPAAPTATGGTSSTQIATTAFVQGELTAKAPLASPAFTGNPTAPTATAGDNDTSIATTAFVTTAVAGVATVPPATVAPLMDGAQAVGVATKYAREDHVHPSDTSRAPLVSPGFSGVPTAPTATVGTSTTQLATTAFVAGAVTAAGSISEAPNDGQYYSRRNLGWSVSPGGLTDAPVDGSLYGRFNATWAVAAPLASPTFTGDPKAPTPTAGDNDTSISTTAFVATAITNAVVPATATPLMDGTGIVGVATKYAREDHKHPTDTTLAPLASAALTGTPTAPTAGAATNTTQIATTAFVTTAVAGVASVPPATVAPIMDGSAAVGVVAKYAREDHIHPSDTSRAALASPTFTGTPAAPTATGGTSTTQIATTAFVASAITTAAVPSPASVAPIVDGTQAVGTSLLYARQDHVHPLSYTAAALTKTDDTNVTLTLGGTPATALLKASSLTLGWTGTLSTTRGGLGLNAGASNGVPIFAAGSVTMTAAAALSKTDDTNVTMTLGGTPTTALLAATSMTLGWAGTLSTTRGGLGANNSAANGVPLFATGAVTMTGTTGTGNFARAADPVFTGNPTAPTPTAGDNDTSIATTAFVTTAVAAAPAILSSTWLAGANPGGSTIFVAPRALTITSLVGVVDTANGAAATVSVVKAASGTALASGTVVHSGSFNANGTANTNQTLTLTTTTMASGDRLGLISTGTFTASIASISVTVN